MQVKFRVVCFTKHWAHSDSNRNDYQNQKKKYFSGEQSAAGAQS
jgi:hypothetical protein